MYSGDKYGQRLSAAAAINTRVSATVNLAPKHSDAIPTSPTSTSPSTVPSLLPADNRDLISSESSGEEAEGATQQKKDTQRIGGIF